MNSSKSEQEAKMFSEASRLERKIAAIKQDHGAELALDEKAIEYQRAHPDVSYSDALKAAMQENPDLAAEYIASFGQHKMSVEQVRNFNVETPDPADESEDSVRAGMEIDKLALEWLRQHPQSQYSDALQVVIAAYPDLAMRWSQNWKGRSPRNPL